MTRPVPVPPGHPWSCSGCQVVASVTRSAAAAEVILEHEDHCATFAARLRALAPGMELDGALTVRPGTDTDRAAINGMWPRW
jgi:hypothetical protein